MIKTFISDFDVFLEDFDNGNVVNIAEKANYKKTKGFGSYSCLIAKATKRSKDFLVVVFHNGVYDRDQTLLAYMFSDYGESSVIWGVKDKAKEEKKEAKKQKRHLK